MYFRRTRSLVLVLLAGLVAVAVAAPSRTAKAQSTLDLAYAGRVALPCLDCLWQGVWCQICRQLPLTLAPGGTEDAAETDFERLQASPWLARASRCMATPAKEKKQATGPTDLTTIARQTDVVRRLERVQMCLQSEIEPTESAKGPRWVLYWDAPSASLSVENTRDDTETALIIVAVSGGAKHASVEVKLDRDRAIVPVEAGTTARVPLPFVKGLKEDVALDIAVASASRLTEDRSELSVLQIALGDGD